MYSSVLSAAIFGLEARKILVEADVSNGLPGAVMVGYLAGQVKESMERVRTALKNSGFYLEPKKITVNLSPSGFKKEGNSFDLPVALAVLSAYGQLSSQQLKGIFVVGELGLNGEVCPVPGILPMVLSAKKEGCQVCMVPMKNKKEAELAGVLPVIGVGELKEAVEYLNGKGSSWKQEDQPKAVFQGNVSTKGDFQDIHGQKEAKRAAEIAVSGFHNLLLIGPPGSGKSLLSSRIPSILPPLTKEEALEISCIYSIAGLLTEKQPILTERPFRSPHHTISPQALAGGGQRPKPGEISLAHRGVLFLDELPEFSRRSLEVLRQPLEERKILISRSSYTMEFPADFMLLSAMNPCKCGYFPDKNRCTCTEGEIHRYLHRISWPLLDRMDLCTEVSRVPFHEIQSAKPEEASWVIQKRVEAVHRIQKERYQKTPYRFNGDLDTAGIARYCVLGKAEERLMERLYGKLGLTARGYHRILKVARTLADMAGEEKIQEEQLLEAVAFRAVDKKYWN